jgi:hypothetical protein
VEPTTQWERDAKWYQKKHPNELAAIFRNLGRYLTLLKCATNARAVQAGFLHPEPSGIMAVDQKGGGPALQETRAYTYADEAQKVLYIITIGNKQEQPSDIELSKDFVKNHITNPPTS